MVLFKIYISILATIYVINEVAKTIIKTCKLIMEYDDDNEEIEEYILETMYC